LVGGWEAKGSCERKGVGNVMRNKKDLKEGKSTNQVGAEYL